MSTYEQKIKYKGIIGVYTPVKMIVTLVAFIAFIIYMREDLTVRFMAHPSLNALIIGTMIASIGAAFRNIIQIESAGKMLRKLEKYEEHPTEDSALSMVRALRKKGRVVNTFYLEGAVVAMKAQGKLVFDDNQARIMKSKVGQRTTRMRHGVQYMAGVLVMLGLIGTFWGLLSTITSVGEAMAAIVDSFAKSSAAGGGTDGGMVEFLRAISKPLQGMGIAFSASLFGLSGSLVTGMLNSFCAKGMDKFLEDFSNWVDARIPSRGKSEKTDKTESLNPVEIIERHNRTVVLAMEKALAGLSQQSQQMFGMFAQLMNELTTFSNEQVALTRQLSVEKRETMRIANTLEGSVNALNANIDGIHKSIAALPLITQEVRNDVRTMGNVLLTTQQSLAQQHQLGSDQLNEVVRQSALLSSNLNAIFDCNRSLTSVHSQIVEALENVQNSASGQKDKIIEIILVMQHILQAQMDPASGIKNISNMQTIERK